MPLTLSFQLLGVPMFDLVAPDGPASRAGAPGNRMPAETAAASQRAGAEAQRAAAAAAAAQRPAAFYGAGGGYSGAPRALDVLRRAGDRPAAAMQWASQLRR